LKLKREPTFVKKGEADVYAKMLDKSITASSMGRVLDSVSCILGICCKRTYEGEPAIKLEKWLEKGDPKFEFELEFGKRGGLEYAKTLPMFDRLLDMELDSDKMRADAAASFVKTLVCGMADHASSYADGKGLKQVGFTGGVSYNGPITAWVKEAVEKRGLEFIGHERISNGDGGISTGQNAIAGSLLG
jgi:hydrogenase maturation protein HypF